MDSLGQLEDLTREPQELLPGSRSDRVYVAAHLDDPLQRDVADLSGVGTLERAAERRDDRSLGTARWGQEREAHERILSPLGS